MTQPRERVRRTRDQVEDLLDRFEASGSTQTVFTKQHDLSTSTLRYWLARRRREASTPAGDGLRFVPVSIAPPLSMAAPGLELELRGDRRLRIPADIESEALARLLPIVIEAC